MVPCCYYLFCEIQLVLFVHVCVCVCLCLEHAFVWEVPLFYGFLQPLSTPIGPWKSISLNFIKALPTSKGYDAILTVVDCFTKMTHFFPCTKSFTRQDTTNLVMRVKNHGILDDIISDRGPQFVLKFWRNLLEILRISCKLSSSYYPQTDGQT